MSHNLTRIYATFRTRFYPLQFLLTKFRDFWEGQASGVSCVASWLLADTLIQYGGSRVNRLKSMQSQASFRYNTAVI